jgi:hypothetical protein
MIRTVKWGHGNAYQEQLHGELDGVAVEGDSDALVDP